MKTLLSGFVWLAFCLSCVSAAYGAACPAPANASSVALPEHPFGMAVSTDGCWMFVAMAGKPGGAIAVLHDENGSFSIKQTVKLRGDGDGEALTHDGKLLFVAEGRDVAAFDVADLEQASANPLIGYLKTGRDTGAVYVITNLDDSLLFVSEEHSRSLGVYDLRKWSADGFRGDPLIGSVPTAWAPVGLALSPDGRWLYVTSQVALPQWGFPSTCKPEARVEREHSQGLLERVDIAEAAAHPDRSVAGGVQAGCNPVRVAVSPDGAWLWVTARDSNALLRIPASSLTSKSDITVSSFDVGGSPVGVAVRPDGDQVWVALSNRFAKAGHDNKGRELVGLIGTNNPDASVNTVSEPAAGFPRELMFLPDGATLAVGLFQDNRIDFFTTPPSS
ncbi:MAG: hypothetical protein OJF55_003011 [Rhodanobacteraceae bacterium]|jgi:DNA-binding beta-propeller fold protein YncE|nr:MAG: hypothetical protein OJF55_003011 [Rhodanobacteraceae bacterium]